jgi:two-component SAPR family response regulator
MIMQCTERGESKRSPEEDVSAGNGATSYIQSGITVDEVDKDVSASLTLSLAAEGDLENQERWVKGRKKKVKAELLGERG